MTLFIKFHIHNKKPTCKTNLSLITIYPYLPTKRDDLRKVLHREDLVLLRTCEVDGCSEEAGRAQIAKRFREFSLVLSQACKGIQHKVELLKKSFGGKFESELNLSKTWGRKTKPFGSKSQQIELTRWV